MWVLTYSTIPDIKTQLFLTIHLFIIHFEFYSFGFYFIKIKIKLVVFKLILNSIFKTLGYYCQLNKLFLQIFQQANNSFNFCANISNFGQTLASTIVLFAQQTPRFAEKRKQNKITLHVGELMLHTRELLHVNFRFYKDV